MSNIMGYPKASKSTGPMSDKAEKPFEVGGQSPVENKRKSTPTAPISKMKEDGFLYSANDIADGEYSTADINKRVAAQAAAFADAYPVGNMGDNDKVPARVPKPTPEKVVRY